jgi:Na+/H+ antiporter NhaD/arsenite permease-like protein
MIKKTFDFVVDEIVLVILFALFIILTIFVPGYAGDYYKFVDWKTIATLLALIITATGVRTSGYLDKQALSILAKIKDERSLVFFLIFLTAILSMFLTNDVTLFIIVPLTLSMQSILKKDMAKVVIFEAMAANIGSTLTPAGNPQNIFLWNKWAVSFTGFISQMFPLVLLMSLVMAVFIFYIFKPHKLDFDRSVKLEPVNKKLAVLSALIIIAFFISLQLKIERFAIPAIFLFYLILYPKILKEVDWLLILTFVFMFVNFTLISKIPFATSFVSAFSPDKSLNVFILSSIVSQFMSNVPGAIFVSKFTSDWKAIAYGVNVAGNGLIFGSLANIISLRLLKSKDPGIWLMFHKYSIPYYLATFLLSAFFFAR